MSEWQQVPFGDLLEESKDGEWGHGDAQPGHQLAWIIRGTDFECINDASSEYPKRWIPIHVVLKKKLNVGDVLLETAGGTSSQSTGRSALITQQLIERAGDTPVLCASFSRYLKLKQEKYDSRFIYYLLQGLYKAGYMGVFNLQHTGVSRFQYTSFKNKTVLSIPTLKVQQRISSILGAYDDLVENNKRRISILERLAEEIYREWFVRMRFPGHDKVKNIKGVPEGWRVGKLNELVKTQYGYTASAVDEPIGPKFLRITDVVPSTIEWATVPHCQMDDSEVKKYLLHDGDILVARTGATVGYAKRIGKRHPDCVFASYLVRLIPFDPINAIYLGLSVERQHFKDFIWMFVTGAAQPQANATTMGLFPILIPPSDLLKRFNEIMGAILDEKEILIEECALLVKTRDLLLPRLISGRFPVNDFELPSTTESSKLRNRTALRDIANA